MYNDQNISRRLLLAILLGMAVPLTTASAAFCDEGKSGGDDSSGSGSDNSSDDDGGSDNSGSGSSGDDDSDDDSDDDNSGSGSGGGKSGGDAGNDHDDAREAVRKGKAISLSKALGILKKSEPGRVLEVKLVKRSGGFDYRFKVLASSGKVKTISMDAATGRIRGFLGL